AAIFAVAFGVQSSWAQTPPPASAFAREPAMSSVTISPDGRHIAAIISRDGETRILAIWQADRLDQSPYLVGSDPRSEMQSVQFVKNDRLMVTTQQLVDYDPFSGRSERSYAYRRQVLDLRGEPIRTNLRFDGLSAQQQAFVGVGTIVSSLPADPESILVSA